MGLLPSYDVVIVGGAVIGSAAAYFLAENDGFDGTVLVVERDWSYEFASTTRSTSAIRQQYSNGINVLISQFGIEFIRNFHELVAVDGEAPDIAFRENGYLFVASAAGEHVLRENYETQHALGAGTVLLTPDEIVERFPYVNVQDVTLGSWGSFGEGWFDSTALLQGTRKRARRQGVTYIEDEVVGLVRSGDRIDGVTLASGQKVACGTLVNAAGPRCAKLAVMAGLAVPVEPRKRCTFVFDCRTPIEGKMPNIIDPTSHVWCRPEGAFFMAGSYPDPDPEVDIDDFDVIHDQFDEIIWPAMAHRVPQFEAIKMVNCWAGHYAYNTLDQNAIVGPHNEVTNFLFANGFSGHGLQQSPAVGRGLSELITYGEYRTLDLSPLSYDRVVEGRPFVERAVI